MSKKIMKRSLALGALMAFVITGSAMAAELTIEYKDSQYIATGSGIDTDIKKDSKSELMDSLDALGLSSAYRNYGEKWAVNISDNLVGNKVEIKGNTNDLQIVATYNNADGTIEGSTLVVTDATNTGRLYAAEAFNGDLKNNAVQISNSTVGNVCGACVVTDNNGSGNAFNNSVIIKDAITVEGSVWGASISKGNAIGNIVEITDSSVYIKNDGTQGIYGALSYDGGNAEGNTLKITDSTIVRDNGYTNISGGAAGQPDRFVGGYAKNNNVVITGNTNINAQGTDIFGGYANDDMAINNNVTIDTTGELCLGSIFGAYSAIGNANGNTVEIKNGTITVDNIYGGNSHRKYYHEVGLSGNANENTVTITGGVIDCEVYGGRSEFGEANNNAINIFGEADVSAADIYGGSVESSSTYTGTGNTLNIGEGWNGSIGSVQNFNNVNFGKGSSVTTDVTLGSDAAVNLADGDDYTSEYAIKGELTVDSANATLTIGNIKETTYNIASEYNDTDTTWTLENDLMNVKEWKTNGQLQVTVEAKSVTEIAGNLGVSQGTASLVEDIISNPEANAEAVQFVENVMNSGVSKEAAQEAYAAMEKMAEAGGQSATAARIVNNVTGVTNDRLSFNCGHSAPHKGGHGVGLFEEGSGADIWVEYVHGKDKVEDMKSSNGASSYEGQYNGFVMGVDFKKVNKFQSGIAFNYGEGDTNSVGSSARTHSDYDFWGVGYYGNIHNDDSNVIFDINYAKTDSDVTQNSAGGALEASPETTTLSAGVKVEKLYQNENVQIVPYTGLRFMSIETDDYATKGGGFMYNMERQNIWLLPVGVSIKQEIVNDNGWVVSPRVDLSYIWAFGDTNSNMEVKSGNGISPIWYDVMDDGSFLGLVGIEAHKGQWGYGVAYSYQKGDHSESKKWFVDVNYSF